MHDLIPLNLLASGKTAVVGQLMGQADQVHRLKELGLRDGAEIEMVKSGIPCIIRLGGQKLCFRADDVMSILVRPGAYA